MGEEKRFAIFLILTMLVVVVTPPLFQLAFGPPSRPAAKQNAVKKQVDMEQDRHEEIEEVADRARPPRPPEEEPDEETRILGSTDPATGFKMQVTLSNQGASIRQIELTDFQDEHRIGPLRVLGTGDGSVGSFSLDLKEPSSLLQDRNWIILNEPLRDDDPDDSDTIRFQTTVPDEELVITRTYALKRGSYTLDLGLDIENRGNKSHQIAYRFGGPRGLVLEGAWYTTKKRDVVIADGSGARDTVYASDLVKGANSILRLADASGTISRTKWTLPPSWFERFDLDRNNRLEGKETERAAQYLARGERNRWVERPVRFAGVDGQFFCALLVVPPPKAVQERWDAATTAVLRLTPDEMARLKAGRKLTYPDRADVSVEIESRTFEVAPGAPLRHSYTVYAGPRKRATLEESLGDQAIVQSIINYQGVIIFPSSVVGFTAKSMLYLLEIFHWCAGNWGVAIIMLTVLVRLCLLPLSRKQAIRAQIMQQKMALLKPELDKLKEKYKNNLQESQRAQFELMKKHGVDPRSQLMGCLPLLLQMPIFIGLWQGLQSSVDLRLARFLWIDNLAAPDGPSFRLFGRQIFHWGDDIPIISWMLGPYFNLLPTILVALFLVQQKMMMPPKTNPPDPQMEMQQKIMTWSLAIFGCFFWRLPSGLCVYYICSTIWGIVERKLLPKLQHVEGSAATDQRSVDTDRKGRSGADRDGRGTGKDGKDKRSGGHREPTLVERINELLKKAHKR